MKKTITLLTIILMVVFMVGCENSINPIESPTQNNNERISLAKKGNVINVAGGSIQNAIDISNNGDVIIVAADDYTGNIDIDREISLLAENGAKIIGMVTISANNVEINGFTITNSGGNYAIVNYGFDNLAIRNNTIYDINNAKAGNNTHAIVVSSGSDHVLGAKIEDNIIYDIHAGSGSAITPAILNRMIRVA